MDQNLFGLSPAELVDRGICPTCFDREHNGALYGDNKDILLYKDEDIECFFVRNPRAVGHMCISSIEHYHDMSEAPDYLNEKIIRFSKQLMIIIKEVFKCERVYICSMCDGPNNHYHVQLIPRYSYEKRGSKNFVKDRKAYIYDDCNFKRVTTLLSEYAESLS
jgi:diadenosine tetraphosphate (Ap4A) HIT family hydrolase